jgi:hypothetical protein
MLLNGRSPFRIPSFQKRLLYGPYSVEIDYQKRAGLVHLRFRLHGLSAPRAKLLSRTGMSIGP